MEGGASEVFLIALKPKLKIHETLESFPFRVLPTYWENLEMALDLPLNATGLNYF